MCGGPIAQSFPLGRGLGTSKKLCEHIQVDTLERFWPIVTTISLEEGSRGLGTSKQSLEIEEKVCALSWSVAQTISRCRIEIEEFNVLFAKDG